MRAIDDFSAEHCHLVMSVYRVTPKGPGKLSSTDEMTQHKFRALIPFKQHLSAQLTTNREIML